MVSNWFFFSSNWDLLLVSCVQAAPVTNGLVAYYDGNLSGNLLADLSGNNNIGSATSAIQGIDPGTKEFTPKLDGVTLSTKPNGVDTIFWMNLPTGTHAITLEA